VQASTKFVVVYVICNQFLCFLFGRLFLVPTTLSTREGERWDFFVDDCIICNNEGLDIYNDSDMSIEIQKVIL